MLLHVEKRGRFTSHMDFADFVLIAVEGDGVSVRGSSLVIAEPGDTGTFERGYPIRKVGHRLSSTTNPTFDLHLPLNRLVGGYSLVDGVILPNLQHRHMLEPAMRRMRSLLATMLASKAITTVFLAQSTSYAGQAEDAAYLWAMGEAATSLSFSAARRNHELDNIPCSDPEKSREAALYSSSAKLFCSTALPPLIGNIQRNSAFDETLHDETLQRNIDAQLEDIYIGPSALQRRLISASMTSQWAHTLLNPGQKAVDRSFFSDSDSAAKSILNKTINLWKMTIIELQHIKDAQGSALFCDARQAVSFAMADRYAALLAVCNLSDDLDSARINPAWPPSFTFVYEDLLAIAVLSTSLQTLQTCEELLFGYQPRFQPSEESLSFLHAVRKEVQIRLSIGTTARYRIATWLQQ